MSPAPQPPSPRRMRGQSHDWVLTPKASGDPRRCSHHQEILGITLLPPLPEPAGGARRQKHPATASAGHPGPRRHHTSLETETGFSSRCAGRTRGLIRAKLHCAPAFVSRAPRSDRSCLQTCTEHALPQYHSQSSSSGYSRVKFTLLSLGYEVPTS